jgi:DNA-binding transcriptional ArsR family regulator
MSGTSPQHPTEQGAQQEGISGRLPSNPLAFFVVVLGFWAFASIEIMSRLEGLMPAQSEWVQPYLLPLAAVLAFLFALFTTILQRWGGSSVDRNSLTWWTSIVLGLLVPTTVILFAFFGSPRNQPSTPALAPEATRIAVLETRVGNIEEALSNISEQLGALGLTQEQKDSVLDKLRVTGYVTIEDLSQVGLNANMTNQVRSLLESYGFLSQEELEQSLTRVALEAIAADVLTRQATCFVEPAEGYGNVNIRSYPPEGDPALTNNIIGFLGKLDQFEVVGHNGGTVNVDRWWVVVIPNAATGEERLGWISSSVVTEITEGACLNLPEFPTP